MTFLNFVSYSNIKTDLLELGGYFFSKNIFYFEPQPEIGSGLGSKPGSHLQTGEPTRSIKQFVPGPQGVGMQGWSIHPVIVSGLGINPGLQSQIAAAPLLVEQIVPGPQGLGSHGSA